MVHVEVICEARSRFVQFERVEEEFALKNCTNQC